MSRARPTQTATASEGRGADVARDPAVPRWVEAAVAKWLDTDKPSAVALVQQWAHDVKAPPLPDDAAAAIADILRTAIRAAWWRDEMAPVRARDPDVARARRIAEALRTLQDDLPTFIERWRPATPPVPQERTLALLDLVRAHQRLIDVGQPRGRGRVPSMERDLAAHLSGLAGTAWGPTSDKARADAFAALALAWLTDRPVPSSGAAKARGWFTGCPAPLSDAAVGKARTRRGHRGKT